jgi:hypothetical protein
VKADTYTEIGSLGALGFGQHVGESNPVAVNGIAPAALPQLTQYFDRFRFQLQAIPTITATGDGGGPYGRSSARLSLVNALLMANIDPYHHFRVGTGVQVINLSNFNASNGQNNYSHIAAQMFSAGSTWRLPKQRFLDFNLYVVPNVRANLLVKDPNGAFEPNEPEAGAEMFYSAAYGWTRGNFTYLAGIAGLSYHTRDLNNGSLVDRNVGAGPMFEMRYRIGKLSETGITR